MISRSSKTLLQFVLAGATFTCFASPTAAAWSVGRAVDVFDAPKWAAVNFSDDGQAGLAVECSREAGYTVSVLEITSPPQPNEELAFAPLEVKVVIDVDGQRWQSSTHTKRYSPEYLALTLNDTAITNKLLQAIYDTRSDILVGADMRYFGQSLTKTTYGVPADAASAAFQGLLENCGIPNVKSDGADDLAKLINEGSSKSSGQAATP